MELDRSKSPKVGNTSWFAGRDKDALSALLRLIEIQILDFIITYSGFCFIIF